MPGGDLGSLDREVRPSSRAGATLAVLGLVVGALGAGAGVAEALEDDTPARLLLVGVAVALAVPLGLAALFHMRNRLWVHEGGLRRRTFRGTTEIAWDEVTEIRLPRMWPSP